MKVLLLSYWTLFGEVAEISSPFQTLDTIETNGSGLCFGLCYPSSSVVTSALCLVINEYCVGQQNGETFAIVLHRFHRSAVQYFCDAILALIILIPLLFSPLIKKTFVDNVNARQRVV